MTTSEVRMKLGRCLDRFESLDMPLVMQGSLLHYGNMTLCPPPFHGKSRLSKDTVQSKRTKERTPHSSFAVVKGSLSGKSAGKAAWQRRALEVIAVIETGKGGREQTPLISVSSLGNG